MKRAFLTLTGGPPGRRANRARGARARARSMARSEPVPPVIQTLTSRYWQSTQLPLYSLLIVFPLVAAFEFGAMILRPGAWPDRELVAHTLVQGLLAWVGASGFWLPGFVLVLALLLWHVLGRHSWQIHGWILPLMLLESLLITIPLFVLNRVMLSAQTADPGALRLEIVLALGAGVYEELVFRLCLITGLMLLMADVFRIPRRPAAACAIVVAALVFAWCHFPPLGAAAFDWKRFAMLAVAGAYLSVIFVGRGLGIATLCHVTYNLTLVLL